MKTRRRCAGRAGGCSQRNGNGLKEAIMPDRQSRHTGIGKYSRLGTACALVLALAPTLAMAQATVTFSPKNPPATMNFTVLPDGTIQGKQTLTVTITRKESPSAILQSCAKIRYVTIEAFDHRYSTRDAGWVDMRNHPLCNFTKTVTYYPFDGDVIRGLCLGNSASHKLKSDITVTFEHDISNLDDFTKDKVGYGGSKTDGIIAHIACATGAGTSTQPSPPANVRPANACSLGGSWPVWKTAPGRRATIPFVLTANQGRNDIYQVSAPNNAGVTGTAVVNGYNVTISLQGGNGAQMQSFSGAFDRSCSTLSGQTVESKPPVSLSATRSGGSYTTQSVHSSRSRPAHAKTRPQPSFPTPRVNTRVAPKWSTQLR